jgi:signal transduction histidine kinase
MSTRRGIYLLSLKTVVGTKGYLLVATILEVEFTHLLAAWRTKGLVHGSACKHRRETHGVEVEDQEGVVWLKELGTTLAERWKRRRASDMHDSYADGLGSAICELEELIDELEGAEEDMVKEKIDALRG